MQNDDNREVETQENVDTQEVEETEVVETTADTTDWKAEAKKWEAIAKRKAKQAETVKSEATVTAPALDSELVEITYRNHMTNLGITSLDAQNQALEIAKKTGQTLTQVTSDSAILAVLKEKDKQAKTKAAVAHGTGGSTVQKNDTSRIASAIVQGKVIKEDDISGEQALELLGLKR